MIYHSDERPDYCKEPEDAVAKITSPRVRKSCAFRRDVLRLAGDGFGDALILHGSAAIEEAAGGEEFGVKQGGASSATD